MKTFTVASALLLASAAAQPHAHGHGHGHLHAKRIVTETEWVTEIAYVTQIVDSTTTVWVSEGEEAAAEPTTAPSDGQFFEPPAPEPVPEPITTSSSSTTTTSTSSTSTTSTSIYVPPPPPPPQTTTVVEEPQPEPQSETQPAPAPTTTTAAPPPPPPAASSPSPVEETQPETPDEAPSSGGGGSSSGGSGTFSGELTYYALGFGACGEDDANMDRSSNVVAISHLKMGTLSNSNPMCGQTITIYANGKSTTATVRDKCMGCAEDDIDVSEKVFLELYGSLDGGRLECTWEFN
jgi:hypothetical protein